jgi:multiple sugar transport system substrate-binding protein
MLSKLRSEEVDVRLVGWWETLLNLQKHYAILPLDSFIEQDESFEPSDLYPTVWRIFTISGYTWAIPFGANPIVMYYNRDLFEQYNVPFPETDWVLESFLSISQAIRDPDSGVFG